MLSQGKFGENISCICTYTIRMCPLNCEGSLFSEINDENAPQIRVFWVKKRCTSLDQSWRPWSAVTIRSEWQVLQGIHFDRYFSHSSIIRIVLALKCFSFSNNSLYTLNSRDIIGDERKLIGKFHLKIRNFRVELCCWSIRSASFPWQRVGDLKIFRNARVFEAILRANEWLFRNKWGSMWKNFVWGVQFV